MQERNALFKELIGLGVYQNGTSSLLELAEGEVQPTATLSSGSKAYIQWLQAALNKVQRANLLIDGIAGPKTHSAVRSFQQSRGLPFNSVTDSGLQAALLKAGASPYTTQSLAPLAPTNATNANTCEAFLQNMSEADIDALTDKEKFNDEVKDSGKTIKIYNPDNFEDHLLYDFTIDGYRLKSSHFTLIENSWKYMYSESIRLRRADPTITKVIFEIHIEGFASKTYVTSPLHNCLLSRMRAISTLNQFKNTFPGYEFEVRYKMYYYGWFKTTKEGEWDLGRSVRVTILRPGIVRAPPRTRRPKPGY